MAPSFVSWIRMTKRSIENLLPGANFPRTLVYLRYELYHPRNVTATETVSFPATCRRREKFSQRATTRKRDEAYNPLARS